MRPGAGGPARCVRDRGAADRLSAAAAGARDARIVAGLRGCGEEVWLCEEDGELLGAATTSSWSADAGQIDGSRPEAASKVGPDRTGRGTCHEGAVRRSRRREAPIRCGFARTYEPAARAHTPRRHDHPFASGRIVRSPTTGVPSYIRLVLATELVMCICRRNSRSGPSRGACHSPFEPFLASSARRRSAFAAGPIHRFQGRPVQDVLVGDLGRLQVE